MTAQLAPTPIFKGWDNNGFPLAFGFLTTYAAGTTTKIPSYVDSTQTTQNQNPQQLNFRGEMPLWLDPTLTYKIALTDVFGNVIPGWPVDNVTGGFFPGGITAPLIPATDDAFDIGSPTKRWANGYFAGTVTAATNLLVGPNSVPVLDTASGNVAYYPISSAETAAGLTSANLDLGWIYGDLRRYKADLTGGTDSTGPISNAIAAAVATGGVGYVYHPGGTIAHASQITILNNLAIVGISRAKAVFLFTGSPGGTGPQRSAWRYVGVAPWSGFANVMIRHVQFNYQNTINFAAVVELSAWGWAYWDIYDVWVKGNASYGIILDGNEICSLHNCLIENLNSVANQQVWIVNGNDRGFTQGTGFSNIITIRECQLSSNTNVSIGLLDDGGNEHVIQGNNFNGHASMANFAGVTGLKLGGNSFENPQSMQSASANVRFLSASGAGNPVGPCIALEVSANGFFGNMSASGSMLSFQGTLYNMSGISKATNGVVTLSSSASANPIVVGQSLYIAGAGGMTQINGQSSLVTAIGGSSGAWTATLALNTSSFTTYTSGGQVQSMHTGFVKANNFASVFGRGSAIDVTFLGNSECSCNFDSGTGSMGHYTGVHNDNVGNNLQWPQNGSTPGNIGIANPTYGDARAQSLYTGGAAMTGPFSPAAPSGSSQTGSVYQGTGAPSNTNGNNGDVYFRTDTPSTANQRLYIKTGGSWAGIL